MYIYKSNEVLHTHTRERERKREGERGREREGERGGYNRHVCMCLTMRRTVEASCSLLKADL